eukprot:TRINITY_DN57284_c0_g1_i1.p1 TRINITY_DN57284_c0_g1~~TRINITY_DN57284_c0_g1_i1.p1  ORF type:complete len:471 (+),score=85.19 TRINITY_DN57284_c0_g1_i1:141-1415(+)
MQGALQKEGIFFELHRRAVFGSHRRRGGVQPWCCPRLRVEKTLEEHDDCVNTVSWRRDGDFLATAGDDTQICLWDYDNGLELSARLNTHHSANVVCIRFVSSTQLATCSLDGSVRLVNGETGDVQRVWEDRGHNSSRQIVVDGVEDQGVFLSCGDDGTVLQHDYRGGGGGNAGVLVDWDLRWCPMDCDVPPGSGHAVFSLATCAAKPHLLLLGGTDPYVWLYDRRMLSLSPVRGRGSEPVSVFRPPDWLAPWVASSVCGVALSPDGLRLAASWLDHHIFEFDIEAGRPFPGPEEVIREAADLGWCATYSELGGHMNRQTFKEVAYVGADGELLASGSDDGSLFLWDTRSRTIAGIGEGGDGFVLNSVSPHPRDLCLATSGLDATVKIWAPSADEAWSNMTKDLGEVERRLRERRDFVDCWWTEL